MQGDKFPNPDKFEEMLTVLQILQTYPSDGFARSGQSVMKCYDSGIGTIHPLLKVTHIGALTTFAFVPRRGFSWFAWVLS
jgi:hypothetical protein